MNDETRDFLRRALSEFRYFLMPLIEAAERPEWLYDLCSMAGWSLEGLFGADLLALLDMLYALQADFGAIAQAADQPDAPEVVAAGHAAAQDAIARLDTVQPLLTQASFPDLTQEEAVEFVNDMLNLLSLMYLSARMPKLLALCMLFGVIREEEATPIDTQIGGQTFMARMPVTRPVLALRMLMEAGANVLGPLLIDLIPDELPTSAQAYLDHVGAVIHERMALALNRLGANGLDGWVIRLDVLGLEISGEHLPYPDSTTGPIVLDLPVAYSPSLTIDQGAWRLAWLPSIGAPGDRLVLFADGGVEIALPGDESAHCAERGLKLSEVDGLPTLEVAGGFEVVLPVDALTDTSGDRVTARTCGRLVVGWGEPAALFVDDVSIGGSFHLGGPDGVEIREALLSVGGLAFPDLASSALRLDVAGALVLGEQSVAVNAHLDAGGFTISSTGELDLGNGVRLRPSNGAPVVHLAYAFGASGARRVDIGGALDLTLDGSSLTFELVGHIEAEQDGDRLRVLSCAIGGSASTSVLALSDDFWLQSVVAGIAYAEMVGFSLTLGGAAGLIRRDDVISPQSIDDFSLAIDGVQAVLAAEAGRFDLSLRQGQLRLAGAQFFADGGSPTVALDPANPINLAYDPASTSPLTLSGALTFQDFGVSLSGQASGPAALLQTATLILNAGELPALEHAFGAVRLPLADNEVEIGFEDINWSLAGLPNGTIALHTPVAIALGSGLALELLGSPNPAMPRMALGVAQAAGGQAELTFSGAARLNIPTDLLRRDESDPAYDAGGAIYAEASGDLIFTTGADTRPIVRDLTFAVGGTFRLGSAPDAVLIRDARLEAGGIENILAPSPSAPLVLSLNGGIVFPDGGPSLTLDSWRFIFTSATEMPAFAFTGVSVAPGERLTEYLPVKLTEAGITFKEDRPLPELLAPDNIVILLGLALDVPLGDGAAMARVDGVTAELVDGLPRVSVDGIGFGVDDLMIMPSMIVSGAVYLGGLATALTSPQDLIIAGKLGAVVNGMGGKALVAFKPTMPLGVCLDISGGSSGIPLGPSGFLLTGVSGGISFANRNTDPCEIATYIDIDTEGRPQIGDPPQTELDGGQPSDEAVATDRPNTGGRPDCPGDCPPLSMNLLCQPHPDPARFPGRAILKFSSIDEAFLDALTVPGQSISLRDYLEQNTAFTPAEVAAAVIDVLRDAIEPFMPTVPATVAIQPPLPPDLEVIARDPFAFFAGEMTAALIDAITAAGGGRSAYDIVVETLYRGLDCPDMTLQVTGTFSYTGISSFLSVTGGVNISTSGSAGILGSVNFFSIPIGRLRAFLSLTDANGDPNPALCGDLRFSVGPLEMGYVSLREACDGCVTGQIEAVMSTLNEAVAQGLEPVVRELIGNLDPKLPHGASIDVLLDSLSPEQWLGLLGDLALNPPVALGQTLSVKLIERCWEAFNPSIVLCGEIAPTLFGLPLGGSLVAMVGWITKESLGASFSFSPIYLLGRVLPMADLFSGMDHATLGFAAALPDPLQLILDGLNGAYRSPAQLKSYLDAGFQRLLDHAVYTIAYEFSPFGIKVADAAARVVMPHLIDHPARPGSAWQRPEARGLPGRVEVLATALEQGLLADPLWKGELSALGGPLSGLELGRDYFPHGGVLGASRVDLPRALLDAPPTDLFAVILDAARPLLERLQAVMEYVTDYVLTTDQVGELTFYLPAPNPPTFSAPDGSPLSPRDLLDNLVNQELPPVLAGAPYSIEQAFLRGNLRGRLLGIEIGEAELVGVPPDGSDEGRFEVRARIPRGSWLSDLVGEASLTFVIRGAPSLPVDVTFAMIEEVMANPPRSPNEAQALIDRMMLRAESSATMPAVAADPAQRALIDEQREQRAEALAPLTAQIRQLSQTLASTPRSSHAQVLLDAAGEALANQLPKIALEVRVDGLKLPGLLASALSISAGASIELFAFSPFYEPDFAGDGPYATVRRNGGIALRVDQLAFQIGPFDGTIRRAQLALWPTGQTGVPGIAGDLDAGRIDVPGLRLQNARLRFGTHPRPYLGLDGEAEAINIGVMAIEPLPRQKRLSVHIDDAGDLSISPARLWLPFLGQGASAAIHGPRPDQPFTFSPDGPWTATVRIDGFSLDNPFDSSLPPMLSMPGVTTAQLSGDGLHSMTLTINVSRAQAGQIDLLPGTPHTLAASSSGQLTIASTGTFLYTGEHSLSLPGFSASGALSVGVEGPSPLRPTDLTDRLPSGPRPPGIGAGRGRTTADAFARLTDAHVTVGPFAAVKGELGLSLSGINATLDLGTGRVGQAGLFELGATQQWSASHTFSTGEFALAATGAMSAWLLDRPVNGLQSVGITIKSGGTTSLRCTANDWLTLLPNLCAVRPLSLELIFGGQTVALNASADVRLFRKQDNTWSVEQNQTLALSSGAFEAVLLQGAQVAFLPSSGLLHRASDTKLVLGRDASGALYLKLNKARVSFGGTRSLDALVAADGRVLFTWDMSISSNGLTLTPGGPLEVGARLTLAGLQPLLRIPAGKVKASFAGWPSAGFNFPEITSDTPATSASSEHNRSAKAWQGVPGVSRLEYRATAPKVRIELQDTTLSARLTGGIEMRVNGTRPNGTAFPTWSTTINAQIDASGMLVLPIGPRSTFDGHLDAARATCETAARAAHSIPELPNAPDKPDKPTPPSANASSAAWATYNAAVLAYNNVLLPAYNSAKAIYDAAKVTYDAAVKTLQGALDLCAGAYPELPTMQATFSVPFADVST